MFKKRDIVDIDITIFRPNNLDANLINLFIVLNTITTINSLSVMIPNIGIFVFCLSNIILTLAMFLTGAQIKKYNLKWSYVSISFGVFQFARLIFIPENTNTTFNIIVYILTGVIAIIAGLSSIMKIKERTNHIKGKEGN